MVVDSPQLLKDARKYRSSAVVHLLESYYPTVYRLANALCGEPRTARRVIRRVLSRTLPQLPRWRDSAAADQWFYHFTVLETRRRHAGISPGDPLLSGDHPSPAYIAFIRAFRSLPVQQREAIVLHHGEHLNPRFLATAMDCSTDAAANHLQAATEQLKTLFAEQLEPMLGCLAVSYRRLAAPPQGARPLIRRTVARFVWPRRMRRMAVLAVLLAVAWSIWHWRGLVHWFWR